MFNAILALAALGQVSMCQGTYRQQAAVRTYSVPIYQQAYAQPTYAAAAYAPQYETSYLAVQYYPDYTSIVGAATRAQDRRQEALLGQANLGARVDRLSASIDGLAALIAKEAAGPAGPAPIMPVAPGKPTPDVPAKPTPDPAVPPQPPLPGTNPAPDDGSVPPPPQTPPDAPPPAPSVDGAAPAETFAVLHDRCFKCHSAAAAKTSGGEYVLFQADGTLRGDIGVGEKLEIERRTIIGNMPKKGPVLGADDLALIRAWVFQDSKAVKSFLQAAKAKGVD